jgi:hypothetical protein
MLTLLLKLLNNATDNQSVIIIEKIVRVIAIIPALLVL